MEGESSLLPNLKSGCCYFLPSLLKKMAGSSRTGWIPPKSHTQKFSSGTKFFHRKLKIAKNFTAFCGGKSGSTVVIKKNSIFLLYFVCLCFRKKESSCWLKVLVPCQDHKKIVLNECESETGFKKNPLVLHSETGFKHCHWETWKILIEINGCRSTVDFWAWHHFWVSWVTLKISSLLLEWPPKFPHTFCVIKTIVKSNSKGCSGCLNTVDPYMHCNPNPSKPGNQPENIIAPFWAAKSHYWGVQVSAHTSCNGLGRQRIKWDVLAQICRAEALSIVLVHDLERVNRWNQRCACGVDSWVFFLEGNKESFNIF